MVQDLSVGRRRIWCWLRRFVSPETTRHRERSVCAFKFGLTIESLLSERCVSWFVFTMTNRKDYFSSTGAFVFGSHRSTKQVFDEANRSFSGG